MFHQHSHTTLKYCSNVIYNSGHKLGLLRWENEASLMRYRINNSSKPLWKNNKLTFAKCIGESYKPLLNQNNLSPCLILSLLHCSHITYPAHQDTAYQSSELVHRQPSLSCLLYFWVHLPVYISCKLSFQEAPLLWSQNLMPCIPPGKDW